MAADMSCTYGNTCYSLFKFALLKLYGSDTVALKILSDVLLGHSSLLMTQIWLFVLLMFEQRPPVTIKLAEQLIKGYLLTYLLTYLAISGDIATCALELQKSED